MATVYNEAIRDIVKKFAITDPSLLVEGQIYYSNTFPNRFKLVAKRTHLENCVHKGMDYYKPSFGKEGDIAWLEIVPCEHDDDFWTRNGYTTEASVHDRNMNGMSYNPWMIFDSKDMLDNCNAVLKVDYERDHDYFDSYRDWDYDYYPDDYDYEKDLDIVTELNR